MKWNDETKAEAVRLRESGATYAAIGSQFGFSADAVAGMVRRYYEPKKVKRTAELTDDEISVAVRMRESGAAFDTIAREIHRDSSTVSRHLRALGYGELLVTWTPEMESVVREMWTAGSTAPEIAERLGGKVTRSSVSNKITLMGLNGRGRVRYRSEPKPRKQQERIVGSSDKGTWDARVFEPWSVYRARRMAERRKMREMCDA